MNRRLAFSLFRYILSLVLLLVLALALFTWWAMGGNLPTRATLPVESSQNAPDLPAPALLKVASYNIGHGQGVKENAWDYRDKNVTLKQLSLVADAMLRLDADIFLLQEVDLDSHRTSRIDQIGFIKERTKYPYHSCALVWEKNYLPFPYWPPAHHIGYVRAANCILSKFPLDNHERIIFDKPKSNPFWYNWFYIDRGIERVDVTIGEQKIAVLNVHLEAWEKEARESQIQVVGEYLKEIELPVILGGDFNTVMPDAPKQNGFAYDLKTDFTNEQTIPWLMKEVKDLKVPSLHVSENPFELYTFPSNQPDQRVDHIFLIGGKLSFTDFRVAHEAGIASDHLPIMATINYRD